MVVYVDDIIITGSDITEVGSVKAHLDSLFGIKDLGTLSYFLRIEVVRLLEDIFLSRKKFTNELLAQTGFATFTPAVTPLPLNYKLLPEDGSLLLDPTHYKTIIDKVNFLTHTRPDLSFTIQTLSQFIQAPRDSHLHALLHVLRYLKGTVGHDIVLKGF